MFSRATITLGIGPHSSFMLFYIIYTYSVMYADIRPFDRRVAISLSSVEMLHVEEPASYRDCVAVVVDVLKRTF